MGKKEVENHGIKMKKMGKMACLKIMAVLKILATVHS